MSNGRSTNSYQVKKVKSRKPCSYACLNFLKPAAPMYHMMLMALSHKARDTPPDYSMTSICCNEKTKDRLQYIVLTIYAIYPIFLSLWRSCTHFF